MDAKTRREKLLTMLKQAAAPVTGTALSRELGVSRQVIVGDIAILRAAGQEIYATPQGYLVPVANPRSAVTAKLACRHGRDSLAEELAIIIDHGGKVLDVIVEHPLYGEIRANLMLASRRDLAEFLRKLEESGAKPLSVVTGGVHLHTVEAPSPQVLAEIEGALRQQGILLS
ncbi:transcription repressor NadR [Sporolituus thermophilus]|uniref:Transcription repressor NadR n=1 Tax=Sporolituus thermophilus DSM 23256 TaxID=1123285 RepID=A0A1G7K689_9FIRM|nr:transcription repressor NadR [Sporolituus thermophilus]SDF32666.1 hypothetical protein SAMN05660235_01203 [Sporolituus thermophilus DSM 23256]